MKKNMLKKFFITVSCAAMIAMPLSYGMEGECMASEQDCVVNSHYQSLADLREKASRNEIRFIHNLSEFTNSIMKPELLEYFNQNGGLIDKQLNSGPGVKIINNFAIAPQSIIFRSRFGGVCLGQEINTREFLAFKPMLRCEDDKLPAGNLAEIKWLKDFQRFRGIINVKGEIGGEEVIEGEEESEFYYVAMDLIDGLNFSQLPRLDNKINHHARYLIAYNTVRAFQDFDERSIQQRDVMFTNFMVCASNFDCKIVDFGWMEKKGEFSSSYRPFFWSNLITRIFGANLDISNLKKYQHGTFKELLEFVEKKEGEGGQIYVNEIIELLPKLS